MSATPGTPEETARHERWRERATERDEPARVRSMRDRYARRLRGALQDLRAAVREGIEDNDALSLKAEALVEPPGRKQFDFSTDARKADAFERWVRAQLERDVLRRLAPDNEFIRAVYQRGVEDARTELVALNVADDTSVTTSTLQLPVHERQLEALTTRNLSELEGLTESIATDLRRELTEGLAAGEGPRTIARDRLSETIGRVEDGTPRGAMNRATRIARTEVMNSHNRARAQEYERAGVEQVDIILANDACQICQDLEAGAPYPVSEAKALIPGRTHPNCRCALAVWTGSQR